MFENQEGRRPPWVWIFPIVFSLAVLVAILLLERHNPANVPFAGISIGSFFAAVAFHLFSVGNTAFSTAASLKSERLWRAGNEIQDSGFLAAF